jgi:hypothetical protein
MLASAVKSTADISRRHLQGRGTERSNKTVTFYLLRYDNPQSEVHYAHLSILLRLTVALAESCRRMKLNQR